MVRGALQYYYFSDINSIGVFKFNIKEYEVDGESVGKCKIKGEWRGWRNTIFGKGCGKNRKSSHQVKVEENTKNTLSQSSKK